MTCRDLQHAYRHQTHAHSAHVGSSRLSIDPEPATLMSASSRAPEPRLLVRPPQIPAALLALPGRAPSPSRRRKWQQRAPHGPPPNRTNRSTPMRDRTAPPEPSAGGCFASELARAPVLAAQPAAMPESAVGRRSGRCRTGSCTSHSSRMSTRSTKFYTRIGSLPTVPSSVRYRSTMATMLQSCFTASVDAQTSTSRSVVRARH